MIHHGDCIEVMASLPDASVDAVVTDPPYGLEFMGKGWDKLVTYAGGNPNMKRHSRSMPKQGKLGGVSYGAPQKNPRCRKCGKLSRGNGSCKCPEPELNYRHDESGFQMQGWHQQWAAEAFRVAKPGAYLLAFGGTRTFHRLAVAIEDAGWIIRDTLVWGYASGFPKGRANLKPAWEPIVMARKPGPLRHLAIDECRIPTDGETFSVPQSDPGKRGGTVGTDLGISRADVQDFQAAQRESIERTQTLGRWPANVLLTDAIFDGGVDGVVGGGIASPGTAAGKKGSSGFVDGYDGEYDVPYGDSGTYSRFFLIPKSARADREPVLRGGGAEAGARLNAHPT